MVQAMDPWAHAWLNGKLYIGMNLPPRLVRYDPAPAFTVGYIAFKNGVRAVLECGRKFQKALSIPENATWLQARFQALGEDGIVDAVLSHYCRLMNGSTGGWKTLAEGPDGWIDSTNRFYAELHRVATQGGIHRNNADVSLKGFEIIHAM